MTAASPYTYSAVDRLELLCDAQNYNRFLTDLVRRYAHGSREIVDFGAGTGTFARRLRRRGFSVVCVDLDPGLRERLHGQGFRAFESAADLDPASAEFIYTLNVLEHISDDGAALALLASRLRAGGRLLIYVPAFQCLYSSLDRSVGHWRRYRRKPLIELVAAAGLRVERAEYADSFGFFATLVFKLFGNRHGGINPVGLKLFDRFAFPVGRLLDRAASRYFGKNLIVVATRPN